MRRSSDALRKPVPGRLFEWVKWLSWVELAVFSALIVFWLAPGFETETMIFGWAHGLGFIALCVLIWVAAIRREAPYALLAATLTPVGPLGSVIAIELIERKGWGVAPRAESPASPQEERRGGAAGGRGSARPAPRQRVGSQGGMPTRPSPETSPGGES